MNIVCIASKVSGASIKGYHRLTCTSLATAVPAVKQANTKTGPNMLIFLPYSSESGAQIKGPGTYSIGERCKQKILNDPGLHAYVAQDEQRDSQHRCLVTQAKL